MALVGIGQLYIEQSQTDDETVKKKPGSSGTHKGKLSAEARARRAEKNKRNRARRGQKDRPRKEKY